MTRTSLPGRGLLRSLSLLPLAVPGLIVAVGWLLLAPHLGLYNSPWLILWAYVMSFLALVVQAIEAPLRSTSSALEEVARVSGASALRAFSDVSRAARRGVPLPAAGAGGAASEDIPTAAGPRPSSRGLSHTRRRAGSGPAASGPLPCRR